MRLTLDADRLLCVIHGSGLCAPSTDWSALRWPEETATSDDGPWWASGEVEGGRKRVGAGEVGLVGEEGGSSGQEESTSARERADEGA